MRLIWLVGFILIILACEEAPKLPTTLPILGEKDIVGKDTSYHTVPDFIFVDQYGDSITQESFANKAYIVDYFFTSCPTICPKVKDQEIRVYEKFKDNPKVSFLSIAMDTEFDTVERLKWYADKLEIPKSNWHFVTGEEDLIYDIAEDFFHVAQKDPDAPGGFNHDGRLILIDKEKHIRSFCNGMDEGDVDRFMKDIETLLNEK